MREIAPPISEMLENLTDSQAEVLDLLGEGLTAKEIAARLGVSISAASQRIERLRSRAGGITKNELARLYRKHLEAQSFKPSKLGQGHKEFIWQKYHLADDVESGESRHRNQAAAELSFSDSYALNASAPWMENGEPSLVPEVLDGENAALARLVYVIAAAIGIAILMLILFAVANALGELF